MTFVINGNKAHYAIQVSTPSSGSLLESLKSALNGQFSNARSLGDVSSFLGSIGAFLNTKLQSRGSLSDAEKQTLTRLYEVLKNARYSDRESFLQETQGWARPNRGSYVVKNGAVQLADSRGRVVDGIKGAATVWTSYFKDVLFYANSLASSTQARAVVHNCGHGCSDHHHHHHHPVTPAVAPAAVSSCHGVSNTFHCHGTWKIDSTTGWKWDGSETFSFHGDSALVFKGKWTQIDDHHWTWAGPGHWHMSESACSHGH